MPGTVGVSGIGGYETSRGDPAAGRSRGEPGARRRPRAALSATARAVNHGTGPAAAQLLRVADVVSDESRTTLFADWCITDPELALMLQRHVINGHAVAPKIRRYVDANWNRPSVREWAEHPRTR